MSEAIQPDKGCVAHGTPGCRNCWAFGYECSGCCTPNGYHWDTCPNRNDMCPMGDGYYSGHPNCPHWKRAENVASADAMSTLPPNVKRYVWDYYNSKKGEGIMDWKIDSVPPKYDVIPASEVTTEMCILHDYEWKEVVDVWKKGGLTPVIGCRGPLVLHVGPDALLAVRPKPPEPKKLTAEEVLAGHWDLWAAVGSDWPSGCRCGHQYKVGENVSRHRIELLRDAGLLREECK